MAANSQEHQEPQADVWRSNASVPESVDECVHNLISRHARVQPDAPAVCASSGQSITYRDLDEMSYGLAEHLSCTIRVGAVVPLCFEKSIWTTVAMLAVLKAQGAFVFLDISQPETRLRSIVEQTRSGVILCSEECTEIANRLLGSASGPSNTAGTTTHPEKSMNIHVSSSSSHQKVSGTSSKLDDPRMACYVVFTSGSTGTPKGAMLSHSNICSAFKYQLQYLDFNSDSRVFDFASYSFDVAVHNMLATLVAGGCLCVPTEEERLQDPAEAMASMQVNLVNLTPSMAPLIDPTRIPTLQTILFLGETLSQAETKRWATSSHAIRPINTYGPAECTPISTINISTQLSPDEIDMGIGVGIGMLCWVVDPEDHNRLLQPGETGELLLEGPLVGMGYLHDPEKTNESFITSPIWLAEARASSRLYKTGDLVRYNCDGILCFIGRKDTQVKIHGQRVELGEIEFHVQACFPDVFQTVVDGLPLTNSHSLVAFVHMKETDGYDGADRLRMEVLEPSCTFWEDLSRRLPSYMVPSTFIRVSKIPTTPSGKTDRKRLRQEGSKILHEIKSSVLLSKKMPISNDEKKLQLLWATVLERSPESFGLDDVFLGVGGDSLSAIQLVSEARREGVYLSIGKLLNPKVTLFELAQSSTAFVDDGFVAPFSGIQDPNSIDYAEICRACGVDHSEIEDIFPSTPIQEGLMALTMQRPGDYILRIKLPVCQADEKILKAAWERVVQQSSIFRTRIVQSKIGLLQVVIKKRHHTFNWSEARDIYEYLEAEESASMELGKPLARFALAGSVGSSSSKKWMVVTLHHALYDAWSLEMILERLEFLYKSDIRQHDTLAFPKIQFNSFASYVQQRTSDPETRGYWKRYLENTQPVQFPAVRQTEHNIHQASSLLEYRLILNEERPRTSEATLSTLIRGALAILLSRHTLSQDVVFGATVSGRTASLPGIEQIIGPTIATVPIRVRLEAPEKIKIGDFLRQLQIQATDMIPFEQTGLQNIRKLGEGPLNACEFQTLLVVQPYPSQQQSQKDTLPWQIEAEVLNTYALTLECFPQNDCTLNIQARYNPSYLDAWKLESMLEQLGWIINQLIDSKLADRTLDSLNIMPPSHEKAILKWNETVPLGSNSTMHGNFQEQACRQPDNLAIESWDGQLSYQNLERYADALANYLSSLGVGNGVLIPISFEKSLFAVIAMLAVLKTGAGFVPIEPSLPKGRRDLILEEIDPVLALASRNCATTLKESSNLSVVKLEWELLQSLPTCTDKDLPRLRSKSSHINSVAYVLFTSGTTGRPKGVVVSHYAASSSCTAHGEALGFNAASRVLQFSSYAFDACIAEIFTTLIFGGCICIPSDSDRLSRLPETINALNVNWIFLTPAVARLIEPSTIPSVRTITIGGEKFPSSDAARWATDGRRVILVYGPTECCVYCSGHDLSEGIDSSYIGVPFGCVAWIVDPDDHNTLMPLGSVGELLIEGPIVSDGYLNSPDKSAQSFIAAPKWLLNQGRQGRLYKTGDLVQYAPKSKLDKGRLRYVGRKDTQVKIRGQRLELAEVEHHVQQSISNAKQIVTEVISPGKSKSNELLIAFVELQSHMGPLSRNPEDIAAQDDSTTATLLSLSPEETQEISQKLPKYMVPELFFVIAGSMPRMISSGKTDRKKLRELGARLVLQHRAEIGATGAEKRAPFNEVEQSLHRVWTRVMNVPDDRSIGVDDNFFHLGGDSILAMRLVAEARKDSLSLTVADVLNAPSIASQAKLQVVQRNSQIETDNANIARFSLLPPDVDVQSVLSDLGVSASMEVEDLYPCSPLQEGIMALGSKNSGDYILQNVLELPKGLHLQSFQAAWEEVVRLTPILRTRIVVHQELGLLQLVHQEKINWGFESQNCLSTYLEDTKLSPMGIGQPLSRFALLGPREQPTYFVWTFHHSLYDGWSLSLIANLAAQIYEDQLPSRTLQPFKAFINHVEQRKGQEMDAYWTQSLKDHEASPFPPLPSQIRAPVADTMQERNVKSFVTSSSDISISTLLRAGLAIVIGRHTGSLDAIFGATLSGRNIDVPGITDIAGPTIATVPIRIRLPGEDGIQGIVPWLKEVQQQGTDMTPFEQMGLQNISRLSPDTQRACQFQTLLVIQADEEGLSGCNHPTFGSWQSSEDQSGFTTYALTLEYVPSNRNNEAAKFRARFDARVVDTWTVERLLGQWEYVTQQLVAAVTRESSGQNSTLLDIDLVTSQDREILKGWNISSPAPAAVDRCVHAMVSEQARARPNEPAVEGWDGRLSYQELDTLTSLLAEQLIDLGVGPEVFVPICFPKSTWTIVAIFGVLKAGGAFVLLDPTHPIERLRMLCEKTRARVAIASSSSTASRINSFIEKIVIVDQSIGNTEWHLPTVASALTSPSASPPLSAAPSSFSSMELVSPTNTAYVIFTSGSTGAPKGCKIEHRSYCSAAVHHGSFQKMSTKTRALQFGSYSFAGAIMEILMTLIHGGCVCVPSEEERNPSLLSNAIQRLQANWAFLTSTVLTSLHPDSIPSMKTICVGGEAIQASQIAQWSDRVHLRQTYGSAETSAVVSSAHLTDKATTGDVGIPTTGRYWIVDQQNLSKLAPLGSLGEVIIEGPTIGREYLDEPQKSAAAFIKAPSWRTRLFGDVHPSSGFYKTGDLGSYTNDGSIILWGRKDTQVKLRGQRIELGEVEHQVRLASDLVQEVAVEIIIPKDSLGKANTAILVALFVLRDKSMTQVQQNDLVSSIRDRLYRILPQYMVPSAFLALEEMPKTISKKTDRRHLREIAASYRREELFRLNENPLDDGAKMQPSTAQEKALHNVLSLVLGLDKTQLGIDEDFFQVGGDSISALKIVAEARRVGMELTMSDIFTQRTIESMAHSATPVSLAETPIDKFSLLQMNRVDDIDKLLDGLSASYAIHPGQVEDVYPCTPLQEGLFSLTLKSPGDYILQNVLEISETVNMQQFENAWQSVVSSVSILRTRIFENNDHGLLQVVVDEPIVWNRVSGNGRLDSFLAEDKAWPMDFGSPLSRFTLVDAKTTGQPQWLVWTVHHSIYDGWSLSLILDMVKKVYVSQEALPRHEFAPFVKYLQGSHMKHSMDYWKSAMDQYEPVVFPQLPALTHKSLADRALERNLDLSMSDSQSGATLPVVARAALGIIIGRHTGTNDILFGSVVSGRNAPVKDVEKLIGPTIATVPIRVQLLAEQSVKSYIEAVREQFVEMIPFEQTGLQNISQTNPHACDFQTLLVVHPGDEQPESPSDAGLLGTWLTDTDQSGFNTYALTLECYLPASKGRPMKLKATYDVSILPEWEMGHFLDQYCFVLQQLLDPNSERAIRDIDLMTPQNRVSVWERNASAPKLIHRCIHDLIQETVNNQPNTIALSSWDGEMEYKELGALSDRLAHELIHLDGYRIGALIPLCFEKSMWTVVAMLAAMKAGLVAVTMDTTQPTERMKMITQQMGDPPLILSSVLKRSIASALLPGKPNVEVGPRLNDSPSQSISTLPRVSPSAAVCVVFTSGSTGVPKGAALTHSGFASGIYYQSKNFGHGPGARIYAFASYSFDISWFDTLHSLASGSTLCIPSESQRKDDLQNSLADSGATVAFMTPSVARLLEPSAIPSLRLLALGGEPQRWADFRDWPDSVTKLSVYGPAECTVVSGAEDARRVLEPRDFTLPSHGSMGLNVWLVDPSNPKLLVPPGATGEMWLEGPLVGAGYIGDETKTAAAFTEDPAWLLQGGGLDHLPGRRGRLYKTGDTARHASDGSLWFMGRKDTQVKIRGQRVELAEVEYHVQQVICDDDSQSQQVVAEIITLKTEDGESSPMLVAFLENKKHAELSIGNEPGFDSLQANLTKIAPEATNELLRHIPSYMVPRVYISVACIPKTVNGKTDRKLLRHIGSQFSMHQLTELEAMKSQPASAAEFCLQRLWAKVLNFSPEKVGVKDNFFQLGGDSISAMRLVSLARAEGATSLSVAAVFNHPVLYEQAQDYFATLEIDLSESSDRPTAPFSLLPSHHDGFALSKSLTQAFGISGEVQDLYPCTPLQEGLLALTSKNAGDYVMHSIMELPDSPAFDISSFKAAWNEVLHAFDILRTRIVEHDDLGLIQLVINQEDIHWQHCPNETLESYTTRDKLIPMDFGMPLTRFALIGSKEKTGRPQWFVWTAHHALYDGWSLPIITRLAESIYRDLINGNAAQEKSLSVRFSAFVQYVEARKADRGVDGYWRDALSHNGGDEAIPFPMQPVSVQQPMAKRTLENFCPLTFANKSVVTTSTLVRASLALLLSRQTGVPGALFGSIVSGRNAPVSGIEKIVGPTIATVPLKVAVPKNCRIGDYLSSVQRQATEMIPYEQTGLRKISRASEDASRACDFQTLLVVHSASTGTKDEESQGDYGIWRTDTSQQGFTTYSLTIECYPAEDGTGLKFCATFDERVINSWMMERLMVQLKHLTQQLFNAPVNASLEDIDLLPQEDRDLLWAWNNTVPETKNSCVHDIIHEKAIKQPSAQAVCAWDGNFTYSQLEDASDRLAASLLLMGITSGTIVPLCFEKSRWTVVAVLGVLKSGAAFVFLDAETQPESRLRAIFEQSKATVICSSVRHENLSRTLGSDVLVVGPERLSTTSVCLPRVDPSSPLYLNFTSGSTGKPKGAIVPHKSFASALHHQTEPLNISQDTRLYDFASYSFDVAIHNVLATLAAGGCLCVPSDMDRKTRLAESMEEMRTNYVDLTASVSRLIDPLEVPTLKTLTLGGEPVTQGDAERWWGKVNLINSCGPSECTPMSVINSSPQTPTALRLIGFGKGIITWIVDPLDHKQLLPVGQVGELLLEGPLLGSGYLDDPVRTNAVFVEAPPWLSAHRLEKPLVYRTGDLVQYHSDGSIHIVGRKDTQVKVRGQRVELEEVEHHLRRHLPASASVVAETVAMKPSAALIAFISLSSQETIASPEIDENEIITMSKLASKIAENVSCDLPPYMVPSLYVPVTAMPMTATGKTNRKELRSLASSLPREQLELMRGLPVSKSTRRDANTPSEILLREMFAQVLHIPADSVGLDDSFVRLGGDSIAAMQLAGEARKRGLQISVADVFRELSIANILESGSLTTYLASQGHASVEPFQLVSDYVKQGILSTLQSHDIIQDILPTTDFQAQNVPHPCNYFYLDFEDAFVNETQLQRSCQSVLDSHPILRSIFVPFEGSYWQVVKGQLNVSFHVVDSEIPLDEACDTVCARDILAMRAAEQTITEFTLVRSKQSTSGPLISRLIIRLSHAQYDGFSLPIIVHQLADHYDTRKGFRALSSADPSFAAYLAHSIRSRSEPITHWSKYLSGSRNTPIASSLPRKKESLSSTEEGFHKVQAEGVVNIPSPHTCNSELPPQSTVLASAWAILLSIFTAREDVIFGHLVANREGFALADSSNVVGPTVTIAPVRVNVRIPSQKDANKSDILKMPHRIREHLLSIQNTGMMMGCEDILRSCTDWYNDGDFSTSKAYGGGLESLVQHQNIDEHPEFDIADVRARLHWYENVHSVPPVPLGIVSYPVIGGDELRIRVMGSSQFLTGKAAQCLVGCLVEIVKLLFASDMNGATGVLSWDKLHEFVGERFANL